MRKEYNERLFKKNTLRGKFHFARYHWLKKKILTYSPNVKTVLELGCFDGKTVDYLPKSVSSYHGYDANWEKGLDKAIEKFEGSQIFHFHRSIEIGQFRPEPNGFEISICMETLEHLPLKEVEAYILRLSEATKEVCFVSIPNEHGMMLLFKYGVKSLILRHVSEQYTWKELWFGFLGRTDKIVRNEGGHKGFNYKQMIALLEQYFTIEEINGLPIEFLPRRLSFTLGLVLRKKRN